MALKGQLSKYKPEYDEMLIDYMAKGYSFAAFAGELSINRDTLNEWAKVHPSFSVAKEIALAKNLAFWERQGMRGLWEDKEGPKLNSTIWVFNMKNRHRWRDKPEEEQVSSNGPQIVIHLPEKDKE